VLLLSLSLILAQLPATSSDSRGYSDSAVNLMFFGSETAVRAAARDWSDGSKAVSAEAFPPISSEYLFGRAQDLTYYKDTRFVRSRHHFRLWRAPFKGPNGETAWVGTANYDLDMAYGRSDSGTCGPRGFYHRIDPDIDAERKFIADSLLESGRVQRLRLERHPRGVTSGVDSNCTRYFSDGNVLVVWLTE